MIILHFGYEYVSEPCNLLHHAALYAVEIIQYSRKHSAPRLACLPAAIAADHASQGLNFTGTAGVATLLQTNL